MTESTTPASTLKIRIRFDGATPSIEETRPALDPRRVAIALGVLVLILAAIFGIRAMMKKNSPEHVLAPIAEISAPPAVAIASPPAASVITSLPQTAPPSTPRAEPSPPNQTNRVVRTVLTDTLRKHQPMQALAGILPISDVTKRFYFFTEVQNVSSRRFMHRWEYRGKAVAQIPFSPSGKNWTGSSSKQIPTHMQGAWRVVLVDERSAELNSVTFTYGKD